MKDNTILILLFFILVLINEIYFIIINDYLGVVICILLWGSFYLGSIIGNEEKELAGGEE